MKFGSGIKTKDIRACPGTTCCNYDDRNGNIDVTNGKIGYC